MDRLVSAHHAVNAGPLDAGRHPVSSPKTTQPKKSLKALIPLTVPEVRSLLVALFLHQSPTPEAVLSFSAWRRHHQLIAQQCHYKARGSPKSKMEL